MRRNRNLGGNDAGIRGAISTLAPLSVVYDTRPHPTATPGKPIFASFANVLQRAESMKYKAIYINDSKMVVKAGDGPVLGDGRDGTIRSTPYRPWDLIPLEAASFATTAFRVAQASHGRNADLELAKFGGGSARSRNGATKRG